MSLFSKKRIRKILLIGVTGSLFALGAASTNCGQYAGQIAATSFDFCAVFNCTSGTFFNLCEPVPLFWDCPNLTTGQ